MRDRQMASLMDRIDEVDSYIKLFSSNLPRIRDVPNRLASAHLIVVEECLPFLKRLITFIGETVPVMERMSEVVAQGTSDLGTVSSNLGEIDQTSERAVHEILDRLELSRQELESASTSPDCGARTRARIDTAMSHLLAMIDALQFQDITSQRVRGTIHLLAEIDRRMASLIQEEDSTTRPLQEEARQQSGTWDDKAEYDPESAACRQSEIDDLMAELTEEQGA